MIVWVVGELERSWQPEEKTNWGTEVGIQSQAIILHIPGRQYQVPHSPMRRDRTHKSPITILFGHHHPLAWLYFLYHLQLNPASNSCQDSLYHSDNILQSWCVQWDKVSGGHIDLMLFRENSLCISTVI